MLESVMVRDVTVLPSGDIVVIGTVDVAIDSEGQNEQKIWMGRYDVEGELNREDTFRQSTGTFNASGSAIRVARSMPLERNMWMEKITITCW